MNLLAVNKMSLPDAAAAYGRLGWPVLPLIPDRKQPASDHGLIDATTDPLIIHEWWNRNPAYNIGLLTGVVFDALDLDGEDGVRSLFQWLPDYKHSGPIQSTGHGYHMLYQKTGSGNHARMGEKRIDWRGTRGYIAASPSVHPDGHRYRWIRDGEIPKAPPELRPFLFPASLPRRSLPNDPKIAEALENELGIVDIFKEMGYTIQPFGNKFYLHCPFHENDDTPSLVLYPNTNSFYCYGCDAWGDPLNVRRWQRIGRLH